MLFDSVIMKKRTTKDRTYLCFKFCFDSMNYKYMVFDRYEIDHDFFIKVNNRNTRTMCEISSKLSIKTLEWHHWRHFCVVFADFEHISNFALCFYCSFWTSTCRQSLGSLCFFCHLICFNPNLNGTFSKYQRRHFFVL